VPIPSDDDPPLLRAGFAATSLVADPKSWINRRVETIEMLSHEETRRRVSVDFTLTDEQLRDLEVDDGIVVPISVLTKEPRRNFDLRDESGRSVPVLGKHQNGRLAHIVLLGAAYDALPEEPSDEVFEILAADLRQVVISPPSEAENALSFLIGSAESGDRWRAAITADEACQSLLAALWSNYVLFAVLPKGGANRRVLKYSYGEGFRFTTDEQGIQDRLGLRQLASRAWRPERKSFLIECPGAWRAASFHAEIAIPEELRFDVVVLWDFESDEPLSEYDINVDRAALYATELDDGQRATAYAVVVPERSGRTSQAALTSIVVAALLWVGVASGLDASNPGPAVSILLAGAALFSGVAAVQGEHRLVKRAFAASRRWLVLVTLAALTASASLAMETPDAQPVDLWRLMAVACSIAAARLTWTAIRAPQ
jgi:hypothetical protein